MGQFLSRLCLNLLNSLPFSFRGKARSLATAVQTATAGSCNPFGPSRRAPCALRLLYSGCIVPLLSSKQSGHFHLSTWAHSGSFGGNVLPLMPAPLLCHSPYLSFSGPSSERSPHMGSLPPLLSQSSIGWHRHTHTDYYNYYLFLSRTPKCCSMTTRTSFLLVLISWSQITMALK